jgi:hypothetical protein
MTQRDLSEEQKAANTTASEPEKKPPEVDTTPGGSYVVLEDVKSDINSTVYIRAGEVVTLVSGPHPDGAVIIQSQITGTYCRVNPVLLLRQSLACRVNRSLLLRRSLAYTVENCCVVTPCGTFHYPFGNEKNAIAVANDLNTGNLDWTAFPRMVYMPLLAEACGLHKKEGLNEKLPMIRLSQLGGCFTSRYSSQVDRIEKWLSHEHPLPTVRGTAERFRQLIMGVLDTIEPGPGRTIALVKLLEAMEAELERRSSDDTTA